MAGSGNPFGRANKDDEIKRRITLSPGPKDKTIVAVNLVETMIGSDRVQAVKCTCYTFLKARPGNAHWCEHVEYIYLHRLDGRDPDTDHKYRLDAGVPVLVTVFAKPALNILMTVDYMSPEMSTVNALADSRNKVEIGVVMLGGGRADLRTLYLEWLVQEASAAPLPECRAPQHYGSLPWKYIALPGHELPEGTHFDDFDPRNKAHLTNMSDLLLTSMCRQCNEDNGVPDV